MGTYDPGFSVIKSGVVSGASGSTVSIPRTTILQDSFYVPNTSTCRPYGSKYDGTTYYSEGWYTGGTDNYAKITGVTDTSINVYLKCSSSTGYLYYKYIDTTAVTHTSTSITAYNGTATFDTTKVMIKSMIGLLSSGSKYCTFAGDPNDGSAFMYNYQYGLTITMSGTTMTLKSNTSSYQWTIYYSIYE